MYFHVCPGKYLQDGIHTKMDVRCMFVQNKYIKIQQTHIKYMFFLLFLNTYILGTEY